MFDNMYLLPKPSKKQIFLEKFSRPKRQRYLAAAAVDLVLIFLIIIYGSAPAKALISPLAASLQSLYNQTKVYQTTSERFSFAPGHAPNKFSKIEFEGLNTLAFFDVPVDAHEGLVYDSRGYNSFRSEETTELFETAHFNKVRVLLTLTIAGKDNIYQFLDNRETQKFLIEQALKEVEETNIDGIALNLELRDSLSLGYQTKFNNFVGEFKNSLHSKGSHLQLAVAIPNNAPEKQTFNLEKLAQVSDKLLVVAADFASPEVKNNSPVTPVYGGKGNEHWDHISKAIGSFTKKVPEKMLSLERAWYGNGDRYPLYVPNETPPQEEDERSSSANKEPSHVLLDNETIDRLVSRVPGSARKAARENIPLIAKALEDEGILDSNVLAYALATIEHETADTFEPLEEYSGRLSARRLGYEGGTNYFGRGFIQLTHLRNYQAVGRRIGMGDELVKHPELAATPEVAAKILATFFKDNNIANLASRGNFLAARIPVNPDRNAYTVASLAWKYGIE